MFKYKDKLLNIIFYILILIITLAIFFAIYNYISLKVLKKDYTNIFGYTIFEVASGSMSDTINIGDIVIVKINSSFEEKDIITYKYNNEFITHRVISKEKNKIITKGDANNSKDNPIEYDMVIGKVVKVIKNIGIWKKVILTPKVLFSIIITVVLFCYYFSKKEV